MNNYLITMYCLNTIISDMSQFNFHSQVDQFALAIGDSFEFQTRAL